uniref:Uncharacterized protein n=1 Tax=Terrapene triunguis TaxID=2587831 RepID=A0A674JAY6_9SAUR
IRGGEESVGSGAKPGSKGKRREERNLKSCQKRVFTAVGWERGGDSPAGPRTPQLSSSSPQLLPGADTAPAWGCNGALSAPSLEPFSQPLPASSAAAAGSSSTDMGNKRSADTN